ncbi:ATP-binding cassette domain-containing protein, partial [Klebsiella pneumoniae]|uniref:ATP-binding cassette domain-containing protein n=1 Tax=Klebsiella pneumoniae TaxID=573 RepID=UPI00226E0367|nr:ATP-binding cassette domain-containing protein [Klebsiella pneumoniae]
MAVNSVDLLVERGVVLGLLGPNGAGKSSILNAVFGAVRPADGAIRFAGTSIAGLPSHRVARLGIA